MTATNYERAYQRERAARQEAERLLTEKTRALYDNVVLLEETLKELKRSQTQLIQAEKMSSVVQLAAGVAHEINNPVGFSMSNARLLSDYVKNIFLLDDFVLSQTHLPDTVLGPYHQKRKELNFDELRADTEDLLEDTWTGLDRVKKIVASLKQVTYEGGSISQVCDLNQCIHASIDSVSDKLNDKEVVTKFHQEIPTVYGDTASLTQIFVHLLTNAAQACVDKGKIQVSTHSFEHQGIKGVLTKVEDSGEGMTEKVIQKVFDPFFTTRPVGQGVGLGLSVTHNLVEKHSGFIEINSKPGIGSCFNVFIPIGNPPQSMPES